jgi:FkbM family methyltransferase
MEVRLTNKTRFFNFFRKIFTFLPFEKILVRQIEKRPTNYFLRKLQPNNYIYPKHTIRNAKRWGINFELDISDYQEWLIYYMSEADSSFSLLDFIEEGDWVLDIGGNIGQTALRIGQKTGLTGKVISFEPYPDTFKKFERNLSLNPSYKNVIKVENMGIGDKQDRLRMYRDCTTNSGGNRIVHEKVNAATEFVEVKVDTLDNYLEKSGLKKIDFIKIDVEGFELNVLKGAVSALLTYKPRLFIEVNESNLNEQGSSIKELLLFLEKNNYSITDVRYGTPINSLHFDEKGHFDIYCIAN